MLSQFVTITLVQPFYDTSDHATAPPIGVLAVDFLLSGGLLNKILRVTENETTTVSTVIQSQGETIDATDRFQS